MRAGRLRHYVNLLKPTAWPDCYSANWMPAGDTWAALEPAEAGSPRAESGGLRSPVPTKVIFRAHMALTPGMLILHGAEIYALAGVSDHDRRGATAQGIAYQYRGWPAVYRAQAAQPGTSIMATPIIDVEHGGTTLQGVEHIVDIEVLKYQMLSTWMVDGDEIDVNGSTYVVLGIEAGGDDGLVVRLRARSAA